MQSLTTINFKDVAEQYYDNPQCISYLEFEEDVKRFHSATRLLSRYKNTTENARLMLNHIIILHNLFGKFTIYGLFFKASQEQYKILKTFLNFLQLLPQSHPCYDIDDDEDIVKMLKDL